MKKGYFSRVFKRVAFLVSVICLALGGILLSYGVTHADDITVKIESPSNKSSYSFGESIPFKGSGVDSIDGPLTDGSLQWVSDDEYIGEGTKCEYSELTVGDHIIRLIATNSNGTEVSSDPVTITIKPPPPPVVEITNPKDESSHFVGLPITFEGTGTDSIEGPLTDLQWTADGDYIGESTPFEYSDLAIGEHTITLTATNSNGDPPGYKSIKIKVTPRVQIDLPLTETSHVVGTTITFKGAAIDAEGASINGTNLKWTENGEVLGTGTPFETDDLSLGSHTIILEATDSNGNEESSDPITIKVEAAPPPVVEITAPTDDGSPYIVGTDITFTGTATDYLEKPITGTNLKWTDNGKLLGTGTPLSLKLAVGTHTITLTATDSKGNEGSSTPITIKVETAPLPVAEITEPTNGSSHVVGTAITFAGTGTDYLEKPITGANLKWTENKTLSGTGTSETVLGTGTPLSLKLPIGTHTITLTATDSNAAQGTDTVTVIVGNQNNPPVVEILKPSDGYDESYINDYIQFEGKAEDIEDGELSGDKLVWTSDKQTSQLGTGNILKIKMLSVGDHLITLTATDSSNLKGKDFIVIKIKGHLPVPVITYPYNSNTFDEGEKISFSGYATDEEDGELSGNALSWKSDIDGYLGNGVQFVRSLSQGEHTITLTAKDKDGAVGTTIILLKINSTEQSLPMQLESLSDSPSCESYGNCPYYSIEDMYISIPLGQIGDFKIKGGNAPYRYYKEYPYIATMDIIGQKIRIFPEIIGETTFKLVDHNNNEKVITLKVKDSAENVPKADAGNDLYVRSGESVVLDGTSSFEGNNGITSWNWSQIDNNEKVVLSDAASPKTTFVAYTAVNSWLSLNFRLTVEDKDGNKSSDDMVVNISDNGIAGYPQGVTTFYTVDRLNHLGAKVVGDGDFVYINPQAPQFIKETVNRPENMIYGVVDFKIKVDAGADANMIIYFPATLDKDVMAYKYSAAKGWYSYSDHITFSSDRTKAYLILTDGGQGDDDGVADGVISDPIAFGTKPSSPSVTDPVPPVDESVDKGGGGGGGCFISTLFN